MDSVVRGWAIVQQLKWEQLLPGLGATRDKAHRTPTYTGFRVSGRNRRDGLFLIYIIIYYYSRVLLLLFYNIVVVSTLLYTSILLFLKGVVTVSLLFLILDIGIL